ncbi:Cyclin-T2 [Eumeta japonica]|uniref:Cyclin-T2 n=1 Tax=Eumeta variegata TaxID=151549 RepID=A0A4C1ZCG7_EUMVA|nr:Cyclin-T2 [Eumeta japonica]
MSPAPKDLAQTSYFMASNSLHLTTMCLQYRPTVVACFCIHLASNGATGGFVDTRWPSVPLTLEPREATSVLLAFDSTVERGQTLVLLCGPDCHSGALERLTAEFLHIFDKCPPG